MTKHEQEHIDLRADVEKLKGANQSLYGMYQNFTAAMEGDVKKLTKAVIELQGLVKTQATRIALLERPPAKFKRSAHPAPTPVAQRVPSPSPSAPVPVSARADGVKVQAEVLPAAMPAEYEDGESDVDWTES